MEQTDPSGTPAPEPSAGERYLLLADISGYTGFMTGVEHEHGVDFSNGIPAAYGVLAELLDSVIQGVEPDFGLVKLEGDAVFAAAPATRLDGHGDEVLETIGAMYQSFINQRTRAIPANDHVCIACPAVAHLDLKVDPPSRFLGSPGRRCRERPARPGGHRRPPPAQEHDPGPDRLQAVPVHHRCRGRRPGTGRRWAGPSRGLP